MSGSVHAETPSRAARVEVKPFAESDLEEFLALSRAVYGQSPAADEANIRWKHLSPAAGVSTLIRLVAGDRTVGRGLLMPRVLITGFGPLRSAFVGDVAIEAPFRSPPSNFASLIRAAGDQPEQDLVFHSSSRGRTDELYRKFFRFPAPFSLRAYCFPVRISGLLRKATGLSAPLLDWLVLPVRALIALLAAAVRPAAGLKIREGVPDDTRLSALVEKVVSGHVPLLDRTAAFLKWRIIDAPLSSGRVYSVERGDRLLGYIATRRLEMKGLSFLAVIDFLFDSKISLLQRFYVRAWLVAKAGEAGIDFLFTMLNAHSKGAAPLVGFPMIPVPQRAMPHDAVIFMRPRSEASAWLAKDRSIHMTLADIDF